MKIPLILIILSALSSMALADDVAKPNCEQPVVPNMQASDLVLKSFEKKSKKYNECISKFIDAQKEIETSATDRVQASLAHKAAEAAIAEFNKFSAELNERNARVPGANEE